MRDVGTVTGTNDPGLHLVGVVVSYGRFPDAWFHTCAFRPVYRPKSEIIEALKQPAPAREFEDASTA